MIKGRTTFYSEFEEATGYLVRVKSGDIHHYRNLMILDVDKPSEGVDGE